MKKTLRAVLLVTAAMSLCVAFVPAHAAATDLTAATLSNAQDIARSLSQPQQPNVTCDVKAYGTPLEQHTPFVVGEIYGKDMGIARGTCFSFDKGVYQVYLKVVIEYFKGGRWLQEPFLGFNNQPSHAGLGEVQQNVTGTYPGTSAYLNTYHRAHAILTTSLGTVPRNAYSPSIWFMKP